MTRVQRKDRMLWIIALVLAVVTYFYFDDLRRSSEIKLIDPSYKLIKLTAKSIPIKVRFASNPPPGYRLIAEKVKVRPDRLVVVGPEALLEETSTAETAILDISQSTRKIVKSIPIESVAGIHLVGESFGVEVTVPIEEMEINP